MNCSKLTLTICFPLLLSACASDDYADIKLFMDEVKARPTGQIEPIPIYPPYKSFTYSVMAERAPFEKPMDITMLPVYSEHEGSIVIPDENRTREFLESFNVESLSLVGHIKKTGVMFALVNDSDGSVHPVTTGNYMGRNHGRIIDVSETGISLVEIVSNGGGSWVERPRTISLQE